MVAPEYYARTCCPVCTIRTISAVGSCQCCCCPVCAFCWCLSRCRSCIYIVPRTATISYLVSFLVSNARIIRTTENNYRKCPGRALNKRTFNCQRPGCCYIPIQRTVHITNTELALC